LASVVAVLSVASANVFADTTGGYDRNSNGYQYEPDGTSSTVLIVKGKDLSNVSSDNIYYIDQSEGDTFTDSVKFLMKSNPAPGVYTIKLEGQDGKQFVIGTASNNEKTDNPMTYYTCGAADADGNVSMAFVTENTVDTLRSYQYIKLYGAAEDDKILGYSIKSLLEGLNLDNIEGNASLGIQINNIPENYKNSLSMYISSEGRPASESNTSESEDASSQDSTAEEEEVAAE
jgi:hypothetical protein